MKKIISLFLILSVIISLGKTAYANTLDIPSSSTVGSFSLRNSIRFGDSSSDVKKKESISLSEGHGWTGAGKNAKYYFYMYGCGKIAGYDDTTVYYTGYSLSEVQYHFCNLSSEKENSTRYKAIYDTLVKKYGKPLSTSNKSSLLTVIYNSLIKKYGLPSSIEGQPVFPIITSALIDAGNNPIIYSGTERIGEIIQYDEWVVNVDNEYYVKIDLINDCYGNTPTSLNYELRVGYKIFTVDDYYDSLRNLSDSLLERDL